MRTREDRRLKRFKAAMVFVRSNAALFANAPPSYAIQVKALRDAVEIIDQEAANQKSGTPGQTAAQRWALREALRVKHLAPLRQVATVAGRLNPGLAKLVKVPKPKASVHILLALAKSAADDLEKHQETIIRLGFPEDFLAQLKQMTEAVNRAHSANVTARRNRRTATGMMHLGFEAAYDAMRCLDVVIRRLCDEEGAAGGGPLEAWNGIMPPRRRGEKRVGTPAGNTGGGVT